MLPDEPTDEERLEELPEDNETPFRPTPDDSDDTHPETDTNMDIMEQYQQGIEGGGTQTVQHNEPAVIDYNPDQDLTDTSQETEEDTPAN